MKKFKYYLIVLSCTILASCMNGNANTPLIGEYVENLMAIPDSLATDSQKAMKEAINAVFYEKVRVEKGDMILDCDESYFLSRGIPAEYYYAIKKSIAENNAFVKKMKEAGDKVWKDFSAEKVLQDWKDEYKNRTE